MLRVALLGAGRIGQVHARSIVESGEAELAWVCDPVVEAANALAGKYGAKASPEPGDAIEDASVDAVLIASATPTHTSLIQASVLAGKKVLCEKPIDLDMAKIDAAWEVIKDKAPFVMLGFNRRFDPSFAEVHARVQAGDIGTLRALRVTSRDPQGPPAAYLAVSGGMFRDMTIHDFDMARYLAGDIVSVYAAGANLVDPAIKAEGDIDAAMIVLRNADGALVHINNSRRCVYGYDQRIEVFGSEGMLQAGNQYPTTVRHFGAKATGAGDPVQPFFIERYAAAYAAEIDHFLACVRSGATPLASFGDGVEALRIAEAAQKSLETGVPQVLS